MSGLRTILIVTSAAAAMTASQPARAENFTLLVYETPQDLALRSSPGPDGQAYWADYATFAGVLQAAHAMRGGAALALPKEGVSYAKAGRRVGVVSKTGAVLSGYFQIEVDTLAAAEVLAAQAPSVRRGGRVEVRGAYPAPAMSSPGPLAH